MDMSWGMHPLLWFATLALFLGVASFMAGGRIRGCGRRVILMALGLALVLPGACLLLRIFLPETVDGRFRAYAKFYRGIQTGMSRAEVFIVRERCYPKDGPRKRPKVMDDQPGSLGFFMNPEHSREPNCEGIFLKLESGRATSKVYSAD
jgi:hypothetical protein